MKRQYQKKFSIITSSWHKQLVVAVALMALIPLLSLGYFLTIYVIPYVITRENLLLVVVFNMVLSSAGFMILRNTLKSLSSFRQYIEAVAQHDLDQTLSVGDEPETRTIAESMQSIVEKLRQDRKQFMVFSQQLEEKVEKRTAELSMTNEQLRNLAARLESIREEERKSISRGIHDELGHALTGLKMDLSWVEKRIAEAGDVATRNALGGRIQSMIELLDQTIRTVRTMASELRPGLLDHLGLDAAIEWQGQEFEARTGIVCRPTILAEDIVLNEDQSTGMFRIFQEILTNVARHAKATEVKVKLEKQAANLMLEVKDNGRGISESQISDPRSLGLLGMQERIHLLGGEIAIRGQQGAGTTVTVRLPL